MDSIEVAAMPMGVVVERREIDNRWQKHSWRAAAVIPGAPDAPADWTILRDGDGWTHFHAATLDLQLFPRETQGYKVNLSDAVPSVFVVLRQDEEGESPYDIFPFLVTACPYEAQDYLDSGEDIVDRVPMPQGLIAWVQAYIDRNHQEETFVKRKRRAYDPNDAGGFVRPPDWTPSGRKPGD